MKIIFLYFISNIGLVYSMESNKYEKLGLGDFKIRYHLKIIKYFLKINKRINQISYRFKHSITKSININTWENKKKDLDNYNNYNISENVNFNIKVYQIFIGFNLCFFL